jgi:hypothetical protein
MTAILAIFGGAAIFLGAALYVLSSGKAGGGVLVAGFTLILVAIARAMGGS